jgi:TetR/AcrR family transcriptional repressor of nem operon
MARIVKEYSERRNEILDVATRLVYAKGYEQMTIQDILDELHISKGAFYHYFDSKPALMEAMIERNLDEAVEILAPILDDPQLPAVDKLLRYFAGAARWKTDHKAYVLSLLRVWYADENAIMRQKVYTTSVRRISPLLNTIIQQGVREGTFNTPFPDQAGEVILTIVQGLGDNFSRLLLSTEPSSFELETVRDNVAAYNDALERVLGTEKGSLQLLDPETLMEWVAISNETVSA